MSQSKSSDLQAKWSSNERQIGKTRKQLAKDIAAGVFWTTITTLSTAGIVSLMSNAPLVSTAPLLAGMVPGVAAFITAKGQHIRDDFKQLKHLSFRKLRLKRQSKGPNVRREFNNMPAPP